MENDVPIYFCDQEKNVWKSSVQNKEQGMNIFFVDLAESRYIVLLHVSWAKNSQFTSLVCFDRRIFWESILVPVFENYFYNLSIVSMVKH